MGGNSTYYTPQKCWPNYTLTILIISGRLHKDGLFGHQNVGDFSSNETKKSSSKKLLVQKQETLSKMILSTANTISYRKNVAFVSNATREQQH